VVCGIDPVAKGNLEFVAGCCEEVPKIKPSIPVFPRWSFAWKTKRRGLVPAAWAENKVLQVAAVGGSYVR
jgi:hypothetical protein